VKGRRLKGISERVGICTVTEVAVPANGPGAPA